MVLQRERQGVRCRAYLLSPYLQAWTPTEETTAVHTYLRSTTWQNHSLELNTPMPAVVLLRHRPIALTCSASSAALMTNGPGPYANLKLQPLFYFSLSNFVSTLNAAVSLQSSCVDLVANLKILSTSVCLCLPRASFADFPRTDDGFEQGHQLDHRTACGSTVAVHWHSCR